MDKIKNIFVTATIGLLILILFNSCTKAVKVDSNYGGFWYANDGVYYSISIAPDSHGKYKATTATRDYSNVNGVARIGLPSHKHLSIGAHKFKIINSPAINSTVPDSIFVISQKEKTLGMKMTLQTSFLNGSKTIEFIKLKDQLW